MIMFVIIQKKNRSMRFSNVTRNEQIELLFLYRTVFRSKDKTDIDVIRSEHRFLWDDEEDAPDETW